MPCAVSFAVTVLCEATLSLAIFCTVTTENGRSPDCGVAVNEPLTAPVVTFGVTSTFAPAKAYKVPTHAITTISGTSAVPQGKRRRGRGYEGGRVGPADGGGGGGGGATTGRSIGAGGTISPIARRRDGGMMSSMVRGIRRLDMLVRSYGKSIP